MAPVKRSTAVAQRETRSTRSAAVAKKNAATTEKKTVSPLPKSSSKATATATATRVAKKNTRVAASEIEDEVEDVVAEDLPTKKVTRGAATKQTTTLGAAPRRRIKVTPLDGPKETTQEEVKPARTISNESAAAKKPAARSRKADKEESVPFGDNTAQEVEAPATTKARSTRGTVPKAKENADKKDAALATKARGRPKKTTATETTQPTEMNIEAAPVARSTRSQRAGSIASQTSKLAELMTEPQPKAATGTRKKVTFQDLPEDDKENQPMPSAKAKKAAVQKASAATSLKAKPVRKTATAGVTKSKKASATARSKTNTAAVVAEAEKQISRVLTPKKVAQVAKGTLTKDSDEVVTDDEDELNGGKTPVRDLSMSPRRPLNLALAQAMSPAKKLNFDQALAPASPAKTHAATEAHGQMSTAMLASPARRLPPSPFKDALSDSPKRGMGESTKLLFPSQSRTQTENGSSVTLNPANVANVNQTMNTLLQSPKRTGTLDASFFSQSAMKKSASKSSFKSSLLSSPAKRLFSPAKKSTTALTTHTSENDHINDTFESESHSIIQEVVASSHFRASASPVRVHRMEAVTLDMDFDDSVLQVGSPLKLRKSPVKVQESWSPAELRNVTDHKESSIALASNDGPSVDPSQLEKELYQGAVEAEDKHSPEALTAQHQVGEAAIKPDALSTDLREDDVSSEDELAADVTPMKSMFKNRANLLNANNTSRISLGVPPSAAGKGFGFTPLAAQMSGWLASSPQKTPQPRAATKLRDGSFEFSPIARQHVDGEVVISRDSTPVQKLNKRDSLAAVSSTKTRLSEGDLKSLAGVKGGLETSTAGELTEESLLRNSEFEEYMDMRAAEEEGQISVLHEESITGVETANEQFVEIMNLAESEKVIAEDDEDDTILVHDAATDGTQIPEQSAAELATDLINFTHASDTAIIDFQELAKEANALATENHEIEQADLLPERQDTSATAQLPSEILTSTDESFGDENQNPAETSSLAADGEAVIEQFPLPEKAPTVDLLPSTIHVDSPSMLVIDYASSPATAYEVEEDLVETAHQPDVIATPARANIQLTKARLVNTVVSKVPLKPEGQVSPIKMQRKRARSFGNGDGLPTKRLSLGSLKTIIQPYEEQPHQSPDRRHRTSVAPSPGGTSTPASRYGRQSLGGVSAFMTPGQTSFAVDDFGDSTLDGIEIPDESVLDNTFQTYEEVSSPAMSEKTYGLAAMMATPKALPPTGPATVKRGARRVTAPALVPSTPATTKKTPVRHSVSAAALRTPLQPVGNGVLSGATVFVDVHTSEGADASGIFVDLLTQMGAKCVKEWRWNPRASLAASLEDQATETSIGITHVVYKDGGKRTLEKVCDTKGDVWCVGVAWVLDCERESKWLDEANYAVDTSLVPRGGSRRRKSMEPRALLIANNGAVSASKPRRSVSAEMSELMKRELVNTPARGRDVVHDASNDDDADDDDDLENHGDAATPTGFISYDPRTAMTPGTPYLVSQGKKLVQMSAPPKQTGKRLFEDDEDEENHDTFVDEGARGLDGDKSVSDAKKFRMKNLDMKSRRRTLGFKPVIGSPLSRL